MIWLINALFWPLVAAFLFAAAAGFAAHALRSARRESELADEREKVLRDIVRLAAEGEHEDVSVRQGVELELDSLRRRSNLVTARVTELEHALDEARGDAEKAAGRAEQAERALEDAERARDAAAIDVEATPVSDDAVSQQAWRLRYFEQRVRYLESLPREPEAPAELAAPAAPAIAPVELKRLEWRARTAESRARHLEEAARLTRTRITAPAAARPEDDIARWRMRYLERRAAYLASERLAAAPPAPDPEAESLKWRARFLEARVRHLDGRLAEEAARIATPAPAMNARRVAAVEEIEDDAAAPAPMAPSGDERRPPSLPAARDGAPDDLTLIEGVSPMGQSTLNSLGVYHFDQIAAWRPEHVGWVDQYLRLRGRIVEEEWVEQAERLAREGPLVFKRAFEAEPA